MFNRNTCEFMLHACMLRCYVCSMKTLVQFRIENALFFKHFFKRFNRTVRTSCRWCLCVIHLIFVDVVCLPFLTNDHKENREKMREIQCTSERCGVHRRIFYVETLVAYFQDFKQLCLNLFSLISLRLIYCFCKLY